MGEQFGSSKLWVSEYFARVADNLVRLENCDVVLLGGPNERPITGEIVAAARSELANLAEENTGLDIFKSIVKRCDLMISLDSGPRHFAVAFDKPVVVLMGSTNPKYTNCNLEKTTIVRVEDLDCIPCQLKQCPRERECMTRIAPETVFRAAIELLEKYVRRGRS